MTCRPPRRRRLSPRPLRSRRRPATRRPATTPARAVPARSRPPTCPRATSPPTSPRRRRTPTRTPSRWRGGAARLPGPRPRRRPGHGVGRLVHRGGRHDRPGAALAAGRGRSADRPSRADDLRAADGPQGERDAAREARPDRRRGRRLRSRMASEPRLVTAGVVGRSHGLDGSLHVERPQHPLGPGTVVRLDGRDRTVERRAGTDSRPLVRLTGIATREAVAALRGQPLLVEEALDEGEWLAADLVGCRVEGLGAVVRVIDAPSCDLLEPEGGEL